MARKKKDPPQELTNVGARHERIQNGFAERLDLDQEIARLMAEHITPLKKQQAKAWKNVSADTGLALTDLTDQYRIYKRQELAKGFDDEADRDTVLEAQREIFEALHAGQTLDFLAVLAKVDGKANPNKKKGAFGGGEPAPAAEEKPAGPAEPDSLEDQDPVTSPLLTSVRGVGMAAFGHGNTLDQNPHDDGTVQSKAWEYGYCFAQGVQAYKDDLSVTDCSYAAGTLRFQGFTAGFNDEAKKDGRDAASVGAAAAAAVKGAEGRDEAVDQDDDPLAIPPQFDRRKKPDTDKTDAL